MNTRILALAGLLALFLAGVGLVVTAQPAMASPGLAVQLAQELPANRPAGSAFDFTVPCDTNGEALTWATATSSAAAAALTCWVDGTSAAYFGSASATTSNGLPVCEDAACVDGGRGIWRAPLAGKGVFGCITSSGTVTARCTGVAP